MAGTAALLAPHVAYLALNVSSPNTPGLRALQEPASVARIIGKIHDALDEVKVRRPVLVKLHPDASDDELSDVARAAVDAGAAGLIATNTTRRRPPGEEAMEGGLSGPPLRARAVEAVRSLYHALHGETPIIGVGGIQTGADALAFVQAGATLVQGYTGFVYRGPRFAQHVERELLLELDRAGLDQLAQAVGQAA